MPESAEAMLAILRSLPEQTLTTTIRNPRSSATRTFRGALLYDYGRAVGLRPQPPSLGFGNYYYTVTAGDGAMVSLAFFEVTPRATEKRVLMAYEQDGEPVHNGVRLVVPGDDLGGRSLGGVASVELREIPATDPEEADGLLHITGMVDRPLRLGTADLERFSSHEVVTEATPRRAGVARPPATYRGVLLWDLLEEAVPTVDPAVNEDVLRRIIIATSTDGNRAVVAPGEVEPRFMSGKVIVATEVSGEPLPPGHGRFRLIVPYDKLTGRALKSLHSIEVSQA
jgi:DMSO/TMAO reductase YedYZ molybdopterin-dependent catalytic subunit